MRKDDFADFAQMLDDVAGLKREVYTAGQKAMFFRALAKFTLDDVRAGLDAHVCDPQRGRFLPMPADVIAQIEGRNADDGRPGADEAWAIAIRAADEAETVVWTQEMAYAWGVARSVFDAGDEVGARVAFRDSYNRKVDEARKSRLPASWVASLGHDGERRSAALERAEVEGRIGRSQALALGYKPTQSVPLLEMAKQAPKEARAALLRLRDRIAEVNDAPSADALQRQATEEAKEKQAALFKAYSGSQA